MEEWKISHDGVLKFIRAFRDFPCLWDYSSPLYKGNDLKRKCWIDLSTDFGKSVEIIKKKIKCLRSAYVLEKKKVDDSKKSGASADSLYEPSLYYYREFVFLDRVIVLRKTTSNIKLDDTLERAVEATEMEATELDVTEIAEENNFALPSTSTPINLNKVNKSKSSKFKPSTSKYEDAVSAILNITKPTSNTEEQCQYMDFGRSIGSQLKQLSPISAAEAMADLQQTLTKHITMSLRANLSGNSPWYGTRDVLEEAVQCADIIVEDYDEDYDEHRHD